MRTALVLVVALAGCRDKQAAAPVPAAPIVVSPADASPPPDAAPPPSERAFLIDERGLLEVTLPGAAVKVRARTAAGFCGVDQRLGVVWFTADDALHALELGNDEVHAVVVPQKGGRLPPSVFVDNGHEKLGDTAPLFSVALSVTLGKKPSVEAVLGCDGDMHFHCYESGGDPEDIDDDELNESIAAELAAAGKYRFADQAYVASLLARGAAYRAPAVPAAGEPAKRPRIDPSQCAEDEEGCGKLTALPGSPYWIALVGNSRGDYYHETHALWAPAREELTWFADEGAVVGRDVKKIKEPVEWREAWVSEKGAVSVRGHVFGAEGIVFRPKGPALSCGFARGWRVSVAD